MIDIVLSQTTFPAPQKRRWISENIVGQISVTSNHICFQRTFFQNSESSFACQQMEDFE